MMWFDIIRKKQTKLFTEQETLDSEPILETNPNWVQQNKERKDREKSKQKHRKKMKELFPKPKPGQKKLGDKNEEE